MRPSLPGPVRQATAKPGRLQSYRLRVQVEREWPVDRRRKERLAARARRSRNLERWYWRLVMAGALLGAGLAAWQGFQIYGPQGIPAGLILGAVTGAVASLLLAGVFVVFVLAGLGALVALLVG
ncbi:MAG: hypothetical protein JNG86_22325 [Verrucomicrobiaceae bacterium]|nr:hypothetical protein [Verrucomicrobiaceae bacterium]